MAERVLCKLLFPLAVAVSLAGIAAAQTKREAARCKATNPGPASAELAQAIYVIDVTAKKIVGEVPTGAVESHMFVISPDGRRAYTSNVHAGSVSVLDLEKRSLITVIPVAKIVQRIS